MEQPIPFRNLADRPSGPVDFLGSKEFKTKDSDISAKVNGLVSHEIVSGIARLSAD